MKMPIYNLTTEKNGLYCRKHEKDNYDEFCVKIIQLYYDDNYEEYKKKKTEDITKMVCI
ncbi:hypothetical protein BMW23_0608 [Bodo saltans virus]|uniref:Uncharacterized protein n=1 Tax=Bodo saltans virus TaxID=2024608 RepID=A0A2H4UUV9_9VIRU|nr:hypothetical protein QJ851_gp0591 [Bodo saltans virus]ATZ80654.1 hypothetical protein BMW23_0608 [Bodo saltans virus]